MIKLKNIINEIIDDNKIIYTVSKIEENKAYQEIFLIIPDIVKFYNQLCHASTVLNFPFLKNKKFSTTSYYEIKNKLKKIDQGKDDRGFDEIIYQSIISDGSIFNFIITKENMRWKGCPDWTPDKLGKIRLIVKIPFQEYFDEKFDRWIDV